MLSVKQLLSQLDLFSHLARYVTQRQVAALTNEMLTPGRSDNFVGMVPDLGKLVAWPNEPPHPVQR